MTNETTELLSTEGALPLTVEQIHAHVQVIQRVMASEMIEGVHYGTIPGAGDKPGLFKAGAEKLCMTFRLAPKIDVEDLGQDGEVRVRVKVRLYTIAGGLYVGEGIGECSSLEDKYAWEAPKSEAHWEATPPDRRRIKYTKDGEVRQVRANVADRSNTVVKMGKKRAHVDAVLTATAASDMFSQDLDEDDVVEMVKGEQHEKPKPLKAAKPQPAPILPYGPGKGKQINDPAVAVETLQQFAEGKRRALAEGKVAEKFVASDTHLCEAVEQEIARRQTPKPSPPPDEPKAADRQPMHDDAWASFCLMAAEEFSAAYGQVKREFKVKDARREVAVADRWAFYDRVQAAQTQAGQG